MLTDEVSNERHVNETLLVAYLSQLVGTLATGEAGSETTDRCCGAETRGEKSGFFQPAPSKDPTILNECKDNSTGRSRGESVTKPFNRNVKQLNRRPCGTAATSNLRSSAPLAAQPHAYRHVPPPIGPHPRAAGHPRLLRQRTGEQKTRLVQLFLRCPCEGKANWTTP